MEKSSRLLIAQIDHVSGEVAGFAVGRIMEMGAHNVHLIPTITKKNRPGNIILIDTDEADEERIAYFLARELKVSGYQRIDTVHVFQKVSFTERMLFINVNCRRISLPCRFKVVGEQSSPVSVDIEHDLIVKLQSAIEEGSGVYVPLDELRRKIESAFSMSSDEIIVKL